jgi:hypothetical protein
MPDVVLCVWFSNFLPRFLSFSVPVYGLPSVKPLSLRALAVMLSKSNTRNCRKLDYCTLPFPVQCSTLTVLQYS